jgi:hypothetical protein
MYAFVRRHSIWLQWSSGNRILACYAFLTMTSLGASYRAGHKIVISLLVTIPRSSLPFLVSNDPVLGSTSKDVKSNDMVLYIL